MVPPREVVSISCGRDRRSRPGSSAPGPAPRPGSSGSASGRWRSCGRRPAARRPPRGRPISLTVASSSHRARRQLGVGLDQLAGRAQRVRVGVDRPDEQARRRLVGRLDPARDARSPSGRRPTRPRAGSTTIVEGWLDSRRAPPGLQSQYQVRHDAGPQDTGDRPDPPPPICRPARLLPSSPATGRVADPHPGVSTPVSILGPRAARRPRLSGALDAVRRAANRRSALSDAPSVVPAAMASLPDPRGRLGDRAGVARRRRDLGLRGAVPHR